MNVTTMRTFAAISLTLAICAPASANAATIYNEIEQDTVVEIYIGSEEVLAASGRLITSGDSFELPTEPTGPQDLRIRFESGHECTITGVDFAQSPEFVIGPNCEG